MMRRTVLRHAMRVKFLPNVSRAAQAAIGVIWLKIYEVYCCVQIPTIPTTDFIGQTPPSAVPVRVCHMFSVYIHSVPDGGLRRTITGNGSHLKPA